MDVDMPFFIGDNLIHDSADDVPGAPYTPWIMGKLDWVSFKPIADYSCVEGGPWRGNTAPVADAGDDQNLVRGNRVTLDGSASYDVDGDEITYSWSMISSPAGSNPVISDSTVVDPSFTASKSGDYVLELTVDDGIATSVADSVTITATE